MMSYQGLSRLSSLQTFDNLGWPISISCSWKTQPWDSRSGRLTEMSRKGLDLLLSASLCVCACVLVCVSACVCVKSNILVHGVKAPGAHRF